ncbi:hypothetical protein OTU49_016233 [Cherax quadricarinatus]|uniref:Uncharacterized protein n=2 Tax=Cherax quadricarinatus TaxID=27406 RepID=A0AAW0Y844_CHEQU
MLWVYQHGGRLLGQMPLTRLDRTLVTSIKRLFTSVNQVSNKRVDCLERRIIVMLRQSQSCLFLQGPKQTAYGCYFSSESDQMTQAEIKKAIETISEKFAEAMELMNDARASAGTVYFSQDMEDTNAQVTETLEDYSTLLEKLNESQKRDVIQSIGLKMDELKAQMSLLKDLVRSEKPFM